MKNVLLVTQGFPYGISEQGFLPTEYQKLRESFHLSVWAFGSQGEPQFPLPEQVTHTRYGWSPRVSPARLLRQLARPEVRKDIALLGRSTKKNKLKCMASILMYSYRAEQITEQLHRTVKEQQIDVVYTYWCVQATIAALRLKSEFPALKVVSRFHGMDLYEEQLALGWQPLRPFVAKNCDRLIFICWDGMKYFLNQWGQEWSAKASVIHVGCRALPLCTNAAKAGKPLVLVSCATIIPMKRVGLIAEGLAALPKDAAVEWHHFGGGEQLEALQQHVTKLLSKHPGVHGILHGAIANTDLPHAYLDAGAQLFITTSETEGLPVSIMEAFAMGIPAAATAVGGIPEMVRKGETGLLLPKNPEPTEVARVLERYMAMSEGDRQTMSRQALESWKRDYDTAENGDRLVSLLKQLLMQSANIG